MLRVGNSEVPWALVMASVSVTFLYSHIFCGYSSAVTTQPACGANEEFQDCGTSCEDTCAEPAQFCLEFCVKGCFCREGYIRQNENGRCIREEECGKLN